MIDWTRVVGFDWDPGNERKSTDKHRVNQAEVATTAITDGWPRSDGWPEKPG